MVAITTDKGFKLYTAKANKTSFGNSFHVTNLNSMESMPFISDLTAARLWMSMEETLKMKRKSFNGITMATRTKFGSLNHAPLFHNKTSDISWCQQ